MKTIVRLLAIIGLVLFMGSYSSCNSLEYALRMSSQQMPKVMKIKVGMSKAEILNLMNMPAINKQLYTASDGAVHEALQWDLGTPPDGSGRDMLVVYFRNGQVTGMETFPDVKGHYKVIQWDDCLN